MSLRTQPARRTARRTVDGQVGGAYRRRPTRHSRPVRPTPEDGVSELEAMTKLVLRSLAEASLEMHGAEPGTEDFLAAYERTCELRSALRSMRESGRVPDAVWSLTP